MTHKSVCVCNCAITQIYDDDDDGDDELVTRQRQFRIATGATVSIARRRCTRVQKCNYPVELSPCIVHSCTCVRVVRMRVSCAMVTQLIMLLLGCFVFVDAVVAFMTRAFASQACLITPFKWPCIQVASGRRSRDLPRTSHFNREQSYRYV